MNQFEDILEKHPFFKDLKQEHLDILADCCGQKKFNPGEIVGHEGEPADYFYLVQEGKVAIQIHAPNKGVITLQTVGPGDIIGWSWLFPPYKWSFDIKAITATKTLAMNGKCLRQKCEDNPDFGYPIMKKFSQVLIQRLKATRMQILDLYE